MSTRIHLCNPDDVDTFLESQRSLLKVTDLGEKQLTVPDIMLFDHTADLESPTLINMGKVCVVFDK